MGLKNDFGIMECWNNGRMEENHSFITLTLHSNIPLLNGGTNGIRKES
jgi:hypothetical protein